MGTSCHHKKRFAIAMRTHGAAICYGILLANCVFSYELKNDISVNGKGMAAELNCTVLQDSTINDEGQLLSFANNNIIKSSISTFDYVIESLYTLRASLTQAHVLSAYIGDAVDEKYSNHSDEAYIVYNSIINKTVHNNSLWRSINYSKHYKVSGCFDAFFESKCRWISPIICSEKVLGYPNITYDYVSNIGNVYCMPLLLEWQDYVNNFSADGLIVNSTAALEIIQLRNTAGELHVDQWDWGGNNLINPTTVLRHASSNTYLKQFTNKDGSVVSILMAKRLQLCDPAAVWALVPIETTNLGELTVECMYLNNTVLAYPNPSSQFEGGAAGADVMRTNCQYASAQLFISTISSGISPVLSVLYPPYESVSSLITTGTQWRPVTRLSIGSNYLNEFFDPVSSDGKINVAMTLMATCINECSAILIDKISIFSSELYHVFLCDEHCYNSYVRGSSRFDHSIEFSASVFSNLILSTGTNVSDNLVHLKSITTLMGGYCLLFQKFFASYNANVDLLNYVRNRTGADSATFASLLAITHGETSLYPGNGDTRLCAEFTDDSGRYFNKYVNGSTNLPKIGGKYTGRGCAGWPGSDDGSKTMSKDVGIVLGEELSDVNVVFTGIMSNSSIASQWLALTQNAILSIIATIGLISFGQFATKLDAQMYTLAGYITRLRLHESTVKNVMVTIVWMLVFAVVVFTNLASIINIIVTISRLKGKRFFSHFETSELDSLLGSVLTESVQIGYVETHVWQGVLIAVLYLATLLVIVVKSVVEAGSTNWILRGLWMHESSFSSYVDTATQRRNATDVDQ